MTTCACGMDCSEFVDQHSIPSKASFSCPQCDGQLIARASDAEAIPDELARTGRGDKGHVPGTETAALTA